MTEGVDAASRRGAAAASPQPARPPPVARNLRGMVSTASRVASMAGARMLERGGNAVDAAVAAAFCLGVTEPQASGIGGQTLALLHLSDGGRDVAIDGSSRAPFAINPVRLPAGSLRLGLGATTLPSTVAALGYLRDRYGLLSLAEVLAPAIEAAQEGFVVSALQHRLIRREAAELERDPLAAQRFFKNGRPLGQGDRLRQPEVARCLVRLADAGWQDFYLGAIGQEIAREMAEGGGRLTVADLSQVPVPVERPVLEGRYRKTRLCTFPPPGAGRALVEILNILEAFEPDELDPQEPEAAVILAHVFMNALRDRDQRPVDPALYAQTRQRRMVDKRYAERIAARIRRFVGEAQVPTPPTATGETTHLCAADADGNVVGITQSIELVFGCKRTSPHHGFFYNNYMSTFDLRDMTHPYYLLPGGVPWSSVAPTLLFSRGRPALSLGSPGSERIATALGQVISRVVDSRASLEDAIAAPRLHADKAGQVQLEAKRFSRAVQERLETAGFTIRRRGAYSFYLGCVQAVQLPLRAGDPFLGVADPRRDGAPAGPDHESSST